MKNKGFWRDGLSISLTVAAGVIFAGVTMFFDKRIALIEYIALAAIVIITIIRAVFSKKRYKRFLQKTARKLDMSDNEVLSSLPFPIAVCNENGLITWCSNSFISNIAGNNIQPGTNINEFTNDIGLAALESEGEVIVSIKDRYYSVYSLSPISESTKNYVFGFVDNTHLKESEIKFYKSKPYVLVIECDNIDDTRSGFRDSEKTEIKSRIEAMLDDWSDKYNSFVKRISDDRYLIVTESENFEQMKSDGFSIIEKVREYSIKGKNVGITLSIGVAGGDNLKAAEKHAKKALELALGRGGDQVAIKSGDNYEFIGGVSQSAEKRYKAKTRLVGSAAAQLIKQSSSVFICGHHSTDLDSVGAAIGMAFVSKRLGVPAYIVIDRSKTLALPLVEKAELSDWGDCFVSEEEALGLLTKKSLFVVVDTHIPSFCEFPELFDKIERRIIIDHHRRVPNTDESIANLFYQDAGVSSACEMVTELIPYMINEDNIPKFIAESLLAGIMLDTKSFVVRAGVRTFEAAAFLRENDADTVAVKRLFSTSLEESKIRNEIIASAEEYRGCAISVVSDDVQNKRIVAAQAADELLNTSEIAASFVIFKDGDTISVSARSYGEMNVQLIMESMGGGGHRTMAACQISNETIETVKNKITQEISKLRKEVE